MQAHWDWAAAPDLVDTLPGVARYGTDGAAVDQAVLWPEDGAYVVSVGKADTATVARMTANLRTDWGRLQRRSRCFRRALAAGRHAGPLFGGSDQRRHVLRGCLPHYRHTLPLLF